MINKRRKIRWTDWALMPFRACVLFLLLLGKLLGLSYEQISVVFNLWVQGAVLMISGIAPFFIVIFKTWGTFSLDKLILSIILALYGIAYIYAFIKMLNRYHLPYNTAFDLCVSDLQRLARKWHTTYQIVNLIIFVFFFILLIFLNILTCYLLIKM